MMRLLGLVSVMSISTLLGGCAVTGPDDHDTARVRAAVADEGRVSTRELANDLGISEAAVVAALPESMRRVVPTDDLQTALAAVCEVAPIDFQVSGAGGATIRTTDRRMVIQSYNDDEIELQGDDGYPTVGIKPSNLVYIYLVRMDGIGPSSRAIFFFDSVGSRLMLWQVTDSSASVDSFDRVWLRYED